MKFSLLEGGGYSRGGKLEGNTKIAEGLWWDLVKQGGSKANQRAQIC